jgi:hypothetical protein
MSPLRRVPVGALALLTSVLACTNNNEPLPGLAQDGKAGPLPPPSFTSGTGSSSTLLGRATFRDPVEVKRLTGDWEVEIEAKPALDLAVQSIVFQPGGHSG